MPDLCNLYLFRRICESEIWIWSGDVIDRSCNNNGFCRAAVQTVSGRQGGEMMNKKRKIHNWVIGILLGAIAAISLFPFYWNLVSAFKPVDVYKRQGFVTQGS